MNVFLLFMIYFFFRSLPVFCGYKAAQTSVRPGLLQSWCKHLLTVFFFYQMSIVSDECIYFWSCPHLCKEFAQCVRLRWRQDPLFFFCCCFEDFKLRIKNETQNIAINHNLWTFFFVGDFIFFQLKEKKMAFNIFFLSYTWQSVRGFDFMWLTMGVFLCPCVLVSSLNDRTLWGVEL